MALITCPHCGRRNVSDYQSVCPACGEPLSFMTENGEPVRPRRAEIKTNKEEKNRLRNERLDEAKRALLPELRRELNRIDAMTVPDKPSFFKELGRKTAPLLLLLLSAVLTAVVFFLLRPWLVVCLILTLCVLCYAVFTAFRSYRKELGEYYEITDDFDDYKEGLKDEVREKYLKLAENMAIHNSKETPSFISNWS